jgi:hypothetical protein
VVGEEMTVVVRMDDEVKVDCSLKVLLGLNK